MKIYTKTGDKGTTSLFNGERVSKDDARVHAYGTLDECNSFLGVARSLLVQEVESGKHSEDVVHKIEGLQDQLSYLQNRFFDLGAHLATPRNASNQTAIEKTSFKEEACHKMEVWIDEMETHLSPLTTFILPGGHPAAAQLHVARSTIRRAERVATNLIDAGEVDAAAFKFMNRVSDYFFVASRYVNWSLDIQDVCWAKIED